MCYRETGSCIEHRDLRQANTTMAGAVRACIRSVQQLLVRAWHAASDGSVEHQPVHCSLDILAHAIGCRSHAVNAMYFSTQNLCASLVRRVICMHIGSALCHSV